MPHPFKAEGRIRTDGLLITNELLCQLSYFGNSEISELISEICSYFRK